jgi:membrane-bound ClpP family serine protease
MNSYAVFAILLLIVGILVLAAEVFIPSGGMLFLTTAIVLAASIWCAYAAWWHTYPEAFWIFCGFLLMLVPASLIGAFTLLPRTKFGKKMLLDAPEPEQLTPFAKETERLKRLVGMQGLAQTLLNPGGIVVVDGERYHAFTEGLMLDPGAPVEVVEIRGTRLLVRPPSKRAAAPAGAEPTESPPLDFEVPQS